MKKRITKKLLKMKTKLDRFSLTLSLKLTGLILLTMIYSLGLFEVQFGAPNNATLELIG